MCTEWTSLLVTRQNISLEGSCKECLPHWHVGYHRHSPHRLVGGRAADRSSSNPFRTIHLAIVRLKADKFYDERHFETNDIQPYDENSGLTLSRWVKKKLKERTNPPLYKYAGDSVSRQKSNIWDAKPTPHTHLLQFEKAPLFFCDFVRKLWTCSTTKFMDRKANDNPRFVGLDKCRSVNSASLAMWKKNRSLFRISVGASFVPFPHDDNYKVLGRFSGPVSHCEFNLFKAEYLLGAFCRIYKKVLLCHGAMFQRCTTASTINYLKIIILI